MPHGELDSAGVLCQAGEFHTAVNRHAECGQPFREHAFGFGLRSEQRVGVGAVDAAEGDVKQPASIAVHLHPRRLHAGCDEVVEHSHSIEHVEAPGVQRDRTRLVGGRGQLVDDPDVHAVTGQFARGDEADGACADNHDVGGLGRGAHGVLLIFT